MPVYLGWISEAHSAGGAEVPSWVTLLFASILGAKVQVTPARAASESRSLAQGTRGWASIGQPSPTAQHVIVPVDEITATDDETADLLIDGIGRGGEVGA